jgi:phosphoglycerol geranylgeranyltransferase
MKNKLLQHLTERRNAGKKMLAVLVDPDKTTQLDALLETCKTYYPDFFLVGSSFKGDDQTSACILKIKQSIDVPVVLFPGNMNQVVSEADGILLLSVISSRNADLIIGRQVEAALRIKQSGLEIIPTGYILVESGRLTSVQYLSQSLPIPRSKPELAAATALAGEQLGMSAIYLEAGSGADEIVSSEMISAVKRSVDVLLFTGGGITNPSQLDSCFTAGTDVAVVGNALERDTTLLPGLLRIREQHNA